MFEWLEGHRVAAIWLMGGSIALFLAGLIIVPIVIVRLPADFFRRGKPSRHGRSSASMRHLSWRLALFVAKNALGYILIVAGLAMLVLPGQGLLAILIGVMLADFPGKYRLERWIISRRGILKSANWLREKFGHAPLEVERSEGCG